MYLHIDQRLKILKKYSITDSEWAVKPKIMEILLKFIELISQHKSCISREYFPH